MLTADDLKACCATAYGSPAARWLLGESFHPGGAALTSRLARALDVGPNDTVVDVASGPGTSALQLAKETGCAVLGVDLSAESVRDATARAEVEGLADRVHFLAGDAEALPLASEAVDGALCECSLCLFPDKEQAARELARVLRPGGRLALSDVTTSPDRLPEELRTLAGWTACLADARPLGEIAGILEGAGFTVEELEPHDDALGDLLEGVETRLRAARAFRDSLPEELVGGIGTALELAASARRALADGALGYAVVVARR